MTDDIISIDDEIGWRAELRHVPHGIGHTWEHRYAMHLTSGLKTFLYSFSDDDARFVCCFAERPYGEAIDIVSPPGFSGFVGNRYSPSLLRCWGKTMSQRGYICGYIGLHPALSDPNWFEGEAQEYGTAYVIDMTPPLDEIYHRMSRNRKRELRWASSEGVRVWIGTSAVKQFFVRHFNEVSSQRNADSVYHLSDETLNFFCTLENFLLVGVGRRDVESVTAFAFTPYAAESLYNVSFNPENSFSTVITWTAMQELHARNVPLLNLGAGLNPGDGWAEYKRRLGASGRPMYCLKQVYDTARFTACCGAASTDDSKRYFPPYRAGGRIT